MAWKKSLDFLLQSPKNTSKDESTAKVLDQKGPGYIRSDWRQTLFGASSAKSDITSISWWRLLSQSKEGLRREEEALNESKADASKIVAPVFPIKLQETVTEDSDERYDWSWNNMKHPIESFNAFKRQLTFPVEDIQDTIFKLDCHTYRPHQVITEVKDKEWGSASEEHMTFFKINRDGSDYCKLEFLCFVKNRFSRLT